MTQAGPRILLTGATGYVGGRLRRQLEERGARLRCVARRPEWLRERVADTTEVVEGDLLDADSVRAALVDVDIAYYLVHSMGGREDFAELDRRAAEQFAAAAADAGVQRIIYLGGLGHGPNLSAHLESRQEVGRILREGAVPTLEFRSSIIVGSGSLSFELIRALVERLPVMTIPSWVSKRTQPVAIEDVLSYLHQALDRPLPASEIVEIGGPDLVSYRDLMEEYARQRGLRRTYFPVPVLSTRVSSLWLGLVRPIYARIGRDLIEGVRNETVVQDPAPARTFDVEPRGGGGSDRAGAEQRRPADRRNSLVRCVLVEAGSGSAPAARRRVAGHRFAGDSGSGGRGRGVYSGSTNRR